jgi:hypothetical protein
MSGVNWSLEPQIKGTFVYRGHTNIVDGCFWHNSTKGYPL